MGRRVDISNCCQIARQVEKEFPLTVGGSSRDLL